MLIAPPFHGRLLMIGCGAVGQGALPLMLHHLGLRPAQIAVLSADDTGRDVSQAHGVAFEVLPLQRGNFAEVLGARLAPGDFLVNASVDVASLDLIEWTQGRGIHYLDACRPYLGTLTRVRTGWTPLQQRTGWGAPAADAHDPWQFHHFRVD